MIIAEDGSCFSHVENWLSSRHDSWTDWRKGTRLGYDDLILGSTSSWLRPRGSFGGPLVEEAAMIEGTYDVT